MSRDAAAARSTAPDAVATTTAPRVSHAMHLLDVSLFHARHSSGVRRHLAAVVADLSGHCRRLVGSGPGKVAS